MVEGSHERRMRAKIQQLYAKSMRKGPDIAAASTSSFPRPSLLHHRASAADVSGPTLWAFHWVRPDSAGAGACGGDNSAIPSPNATHTLDHHRRGGRLRNDQERDTVCHQPEPPGPLRPLEWVLPGR